MFQSLRATQHRSRETQRAALSSRCVTAIPILAIAAVDDDPVLAWQMPSMLLETATAMISAVAGVTAATRRTGVFRAMAAARATADMTRPKLAGSTAWPKATHTVRCELRNSR